MCLTFSFFLTLVCVTRVRTFYLGFLGVLVPVTAFSDLSATPNFRSERYPSLLSLGFSEALSRVCFPFSVLSAPTSSISCRSVT